MNPIRIINDQVLIRLMPAEPKTPGGVYLPEQSVQDAQQGVVVQVGDGYSLRSGKAPLEVHVGDHVLFPAYAGFEISLEDERYVIVLERDILAILHPEST